MKYGSVCSGVEAATLAWHPMGWQAQFYSEIEPFPCSVLAHHYPDVPNLGDMTKFKEWPDYAIDVLVGGTPCQSFSVAGLRKGLDDPRGNLMLTYLAIADRYRPRWVVWENVPGVLSSNGGKDFGTFLGGLGELGYGFAYRVLDAQYFGVPQRRRRVFVVGYLGDWRRAAAVLFERHSLQGHNPPSRKTGQTVAGTIAKGAFSGGAGGRPEGAAGNHFLPVGIDEECNATVDGFGPLLRGGQGGTRQAVATFDRQSSSEYGTSPVASTVSARDYKSAADLVLAFHVDAQPDEMRFDSHVSATLTKSQHAGVMTIDRIGGWVDREDRCFAFQSDSKRSTVQEHIYHKAAGCADTLTQQKQHILNSAVRRLTPIECERLQGFPDNYTLVPHRGKPAADGPRYKSIGNSMNRECMEYIGQRIQMVETLTGGM